MHVPTSPAYPRRVSLVLVGCMEVVASLHVYVQTVLPYEVSGLWDTIPPVFMRSTIWGICGVAAILGAFFKRLQMVGFVMATIPATAHALSCYWSWLMWTTPGGPGGYEVAIWEAAWWSLYVALIVWSAGLSRARKAPR